MSARRSATRAACRAAGLPHWAAALSTIRGKCRGRLGRKRCPSRWAVVRVSLDFRGDRVDRIATAECALCGRTWRRIAVPPLRTHDGLQAVRLTLILPATARRWYSRGRWHRDGDDGEVLRDADLGDLDEAARAHGVRADRKADSRARAAAKKAEAEAEAHERTMDLLARLRAMDEAREADEAAAREREDAA